MKTALESFMEGIMDYAGLFPPASLDPQKALGNYQAHKTAAMGWMLNTFIIPAPLLNHWETLSPPPIPLTLILPPTAPTPHTSAPHTSSPGIKALETRVTDLEPTATAERVAQLKKWAPKRPSPPIFLEAAPQARSVELIHSLGRLKDKAGFKLRCGGEEDPPAPELVGQTLMACAHHDLPMKFTAGLHHPISHWSPQKGKQRYGFINVFTAALLAFTKRLVPKEIEACLLDEMPDHFTFDPDQLIWKEHALSSRAIHSLRKNRITGFGSCSFETPVAELAALGFMSTP